MGDGYAVTISPQAAAEVVRIVEWWRKNRPRAPRMFQEELDDALVLISAHPEIGRRARSRRVGNAHVVTLVRSGYRVFYQLLPVTREVLVVHVRHARRRPLHAVR